MMRIGFLPSDFNPMILMLGEAEDCRALSFVLREFARQGETVRLRDLVFCTCCVVDILLTRADGSPGVYSENDDTFVWQLSPDIAAGFADQLDHLANPACMAGSEYLDCNTADGITIKVSRGEYTDDFLSGPQPPASSGAVL